jgi:hypothetical protein
VSVFCRRKTWHRTDQGLKAQFQCSRLDRVLPALALARRFCQDEYRRHVLIG